jgi:hypothetical protein
LEERGEEIKRQNDLDAISLARNKVVASSHETNETQTRKKLIEQAERRKKRRRMT